MTTSTLTPPPGPTEPSSERGREFEIVIEPRRVDKEYWKDLWRYRELFFFIAWRDVLVRYKQAVFGIAWALTKYFLSRFPRCPIIAAAL